MFRTIVKLAHRGVALLSLVVPIVAKAQVCVYVADQGSNDLTVINTVTHTLIGRIPLAGTPGAMAAAADGERVFVLVSSLQGSHAQPSHQLVTIDTPTRRVVGRVTLPAKALDIVITPDRRTAYVSHPTADTISVIDLENQRVQGSLATTVVPSPGKLGIAADGMRLYVGDSERPLLEIVALADGAKSELFALAGKSNDLAIAGNTAYVATDTTLDRVVPTWAPVTLSSGNVADGGVSDGREWTFEWNFNFSLNGTFGLSREQIEQLCLPALQGASQFQGLYEACLTVLTHAQSTALQSPGEAIAVGNAYTVYVAETARDVVSVVDTHGLNNRSEIAVGATPVGVALTPDQSTLYVTNTGSATVSVFDTNTGSLLTSIPVGTAPRGIAIFSASRGCSLPRCVGDCDGNGATSIDELQLGVAIAMGRQPLNTCSAADADGDGSVDIDELVSSIESALDHCMN